jgi:hypothetical protein
MHSLVLLQSGIIEKHLHRPAQHRNLLVAHSDHTLAEAAGFTVARNRLKTPE